MSRDNSSPGETRTMEDSAKKMGLLVLLLFQNALLILSMRYTRVGDGPMYFTTTAVALSEFSKMVICAVLIFLEHTREKKSFLDFCAYMYQSVIGNWTDTMKLSVPALVYALQNNLQYVAVSNLNAAVFQILYQLKIFTTALFSVTMLSRSLSRTQYLSLCLLFVGVCLVTVDMAGGGGGEGGDQMGRKEQNQNIWVGLAAVIVSCLSSGFAGVYFEKVLKSPNTTSSSSASPDQRQPPSVWLRNVQLGIFGSVSAIVGMLMKDGASIRQHGFLHGYTLLVWLVVSQQAVGGLIVALVVKYADNIVKGYATSLSIIVSAIASVYLFSFSLTVLFGVGTATVIVATVLYAWQPSVRDPSSSSPNAKHEGSNAS